MTAWFLFGSVLPSLLVKTLQVLKLAGDRVKYTVAHGLVCVLFCQFTSRALQPEFRHRFRSVKTFLCIMVNLVILFFNAKKKKKKKLVDSVY